MNNYQTVIDMQDFMDELGVYVLTFDRTGYGESDPKPKRPVKIEAFDIQELANQLNLGHKFDVIAHWDLHFNILIWACLKYTPHRHVTDCVPILCSKPSWGFRKYSIPMHFCFHIS